MITAVGKHGTQFFRMACINITQLIWLQHSMRKANLEEQPCDSSELERVADSNTEAD
jgi:hypothetical protein